MLQRFIRTSATSSWQLMFEPRRRPWQVLATVAVVAFGLGLLVREAVDLWLSKIAKR